MPNIITEQSKLNDSVTVIRRQEVTESAKAEDVFKVKRVAAYARVSRNLEIQESSLETQIESYEETISKKPGWQLVEVFYDKGVTGTCANKRPNFMRMIEECKKGNIDMIIAKSISRFARNTMDTLKYTRELRDIGVGVYFEKERINTNDLTSEMLLTVYAAFAQEESHSISENIRKGFRSRFQMGVPKYSRTYGYRPSKEDKTVWDIVPEEAEVIRRLFDASIHGIPISTILKELNEKKIPSPLGKGWTSKCAGDMLKNEKYKGDVLMQKTYCTDVLRHISRRNQDNAVPQYYRKAHHEPIIDSETFDIVQRGLLLKRTLDGSHQYPYYDFIKCPLCGKPMVQFYFPFNKNPRAWICSDHNNCKHYSLRTKYIDNAVKEAFKSLPPYISGYEHVLRDLKEHLDNGGEIEYYYLKKLIKEIEIDKEFTTLTVKFLFDYEYKYTIKYEKPSEYAIPLVEYKAGNLYVNGKFTYPKVGTFVVGAINRLQAFVDSVQIIPPKDEKDIFRAINIQPRWNFKRAKEAKLEKERLENENNSNQADIE